MYRLGRLVEVHAGKVLVLGVLVLLAAGVGLRDAVMETRVEKLWVEGKKEKNILLMYRWDKYMP